MNSWDRAYEGVPPWDIGRPQPEFVRLCASGEIVGRVLDIGCGTGENAIHFAAGGHPTWGIDFSRNAVRKAQAKAAGRDLPVTFRFADALELGALNERFDTATDCGLFHTLSDPERPIYAASVRSILRSGGRLFILCFSEEEPADWDGPRRVTQEELRSTFREGWEVQSINPAEFATTEPGITGRAWRARFDRAKP